MRFIVLIPVLVLASCSSPTRQCETQFDCFGDEVCIEGTCSTQIVLTLDTSQPDSARDVGTESDAGRDMSRPPPDLSSPPADGGDMAGCMSACTDEQVCDEGACVPAPAVTVWTLNGQEVARQKTVEGLHQDAFDSVFVGLPHWGRNIQINIADVSSTAPFSVTCDNYAQYNAFTFLTSDNSWADLDDVPDRWKGPLFTGAQCAAGPDEDRLTEWNLELTTLTARRVVGSVEIEVVGAGTRAGETLRVTSNFAVDLEQN